MLAAKAGGSAELCQKKGCLIQVGPFLEMSLAMDADGLRLITKTVHNLFTLLYIFVNINLHVSFILLTLAKGFAICTSKTFMEPQKFLLKHTDVSTYYICWSQE